MKVISSRVGKATNGPSRTTVVQVANSDEIVALQVVVEADHYEPQCRVHVRALNVATNEWGSPLVWRTAKATLATYDGQHQHREAMMIRDEQDALADAIAILNAGRKEDLE